MSGSRRIPLARAFALGIAAVVVLVLAVVVIRPNTDRSNQAVRGPPLAADTRLVLLVVIDQFPAVFLERFAPYFGERGFNLLLREGASIESAIYPYATTDTCPGHAVIATGTWPNRSGIVANSWYDRAAERVRFCSADPEAGLLPRGGGGHSPRWLLEPAIGDLIKSSASTGPARVIGVGGKGYAVIMLGGARADAVYWSDDTLMVSSSYYLDQLPGWVRRFNSSGRFSRYFGSRWERTLSAAAYDSVGADDVAVEDGSDGLGRTFPHVIDGGGDDLGAAFVAALAATPFHDGVITEFAMEALRHEQLGQDEHTDLLAVALSANDRIGHRFGPDSHEALDAVVRTDRLLEHLFAVVDAAVGLEHTLIVVTSDHGVAPFPELPRPQAGRPSETGDGGPARISEEALLRRATDALDAAYGRPGDGRWIAFHDYPYLYLDPRVVAAAGATARDAERIAARAVAQVPGVLHAWSQEELVAASGGDGRDGVPPGILLSFHAERSGSVLYEVSAYFLVDDDDRGTNHGTRWLYDAHVPLLWKGPGIRPGTYTLSATPADVAPTLAALLGIAPGSRTQGRVIHEIFSPTE